MLGPNIQKLMCTLAFHTKYKMVWNYESEVNSYLFHTTTYQHQTQKSLQKMKVRHLYLDRFLASFLTLISYLNGIGGYVNSLKTMCVHTHWMQALIACKPEDLSSTKCFVNLKKKMKFIYLVKYMSILLFQLQKQF